MTPMEASYNNGTIPAVLKYYDYFVLLFRVSHPPESGMYILSLPSPWLHWDKGIPRLASTCLYILHYLRYLMYATLLPLWIHRAVQERAESLSLIIIGSLSGDRERHSLHIDTRIDM